MRVVFIFVVYFLLSISNIYAKDDLNKLINYTFEKNLSSKKVSIIKKDILEFLSVDEKKADKRLAKNRDLEEYLHFLLKKSVIKKISLKEIFKQEIKKRDTLLQQLSKLEKQNGDRNFIIILNKAKRALKSFDFKSYHKILSSYIEDKKNLIILSNIAMAKYLKVNEYYNRTLYSKTKEEIDKSVTDRVNNKYLVLYGKLLYKIGEYDKALELFSKNLEVENSIKNKKSKISTAYNNIGLIYAKKGEYEKALEYYFKDLNIILQNYGEYHHSVATTYNNIGMVYYKMGKYEDSIEFIKKALFIYELTLGPQHENTKAIIEAFDIISEKLIGKGKYE